MNDNIKIKSRVKSARKRRLYKHSNSITEIQLIFTIRYQSLEKNTPDTGSLKWRMGGCRAKSLSVYCWYCLDHLPLPETEGTRKAILIQHRDAGMNIHSLKRWLKK